MFVRGRKRRDGGHISLLLSATLETALGPQAAAVPLTDAPSSADAFTRQVLKTDFYQRALVAPEEVEVLAKHFQGEYNWDSPDFDILSAARTTKPLVSTVCTEVLYPESAMETAFNAPDVEGGPRPPLDERGPHPAEARTTRIVPAPYSPMEDRKEHEKKLYREIEDAYNPMLDPEVAAYLMTPQTRREVIGAILNPDVYPTPVPMEVNLWDIPKPAEDEYVRGVRLSDLQHPNDWRLMRKDVGDLQLREVDRVVHIAQTPFVSHRKRQLIREDLWAANRKQLVRRNPLFEAVRNRREEEYCRFFLRGRHNLNRVFRVRQHYLRRTELNDRHLKAALERYDDAEIERYRDKLRWMEEMTNEEEMARQRRLAEMDKEWEDMAWWKYLYWVPWVLLNQVGAKRATDV